MNRNGMTVIPAKVVARLHIRSTDTYPDVEVEVLDGTDLQPEHSPVDVYLAPPGAGPVLPEGWRIEREHEDVLALHQRGTAQPTRYAKGEVIHSLLSDLIGQCAECGGRMEHEDGEAWDGPSNGCVDCGISTATSRAVAAETVPSAKVGDSPQRPLDDPRLQALFGDAIEGALALGYQASSPPPTGHWLQRFWDIGNAERGQTARNVEPAAGCALVDAVNSLAGQLESMASERPADDLQWRALLERSDALRTALKALPGSA